MEKIRIRDGKNSDPGSGIEKFGSGMEKIRIRDLGKLSRIHNTARKETLFSMNSEYLGRSSSLAASTSLKTTRQASR